MGNADATAARTVVDGLIAVCDGDPEPLRTGGVHAANVTVIDYQAGLEQGFDQLCAWLRRVNQPGSGWRLVREVGDIQRARHDGQVGLIMGWQNTLPLGSQLDRIDGFHALGVRIMQLTYNEANVLADGCGEARAGGLTALGRAAVQRLNEVGVSIDLSHCAEATVIEACSISDKPVLLTHANAKAIHARARNKSDAALRAVAATGGVIGVSVHGFLNWGGDPSRRPSLADFVRHARHIAEVVGAEHLAIGTDLACVQSTAAVQQVLDASASRYGGMVGAYVAAFGNDLAGRYPPDVPSPREFPRILDALRDGGFTERELDGIAGGNLMSALDQAWRVAGRCRAAGAPDHGAEPAKP